MFLENFLSSDTGKTSITELGKTSTTYTAVYLYWREQLFERVMRLFVWENTFEVPAKEIEQRLLLQGHCGITKYKGELTAFFGSFFGPTKYNDEFSDYTIRCPIYSGTRKIDKDIIVINNNSLRNAVYPLVHHYATQLAHNDVTITNVLINARDSGGVPIASTEKQKKSIEQYLSKLYNGQYSVVTDLGALGVNYVGTNRGTGQDIKALWETRQNILKAFYSDIGVRSAFEKANNSVTAEVEADTSLLLLNLSDMIDSRKRGCDAVNNMFGTNWSVSIAKELEYTLDPMESEVVENEDSE